MTLPKETRQMRTQARVPACIWLAVSLCVTALHGGGAEDSVERVTLERLARDPEFTNFLASGCSVVCTVKTTIAQTVLDGPLRVYNTNGAVVLEWNLKDGLLHGKVSRYFPNGRPSSSRAFYERGLMQGTEFYWFEDGHVGRTTGYQAGKKHGLETYWLPDGSVSSRLEWRQDEVLAVELYEDGKPKQRLTGEEARTFFRQKGHEAARKLLSK